MIRSGSILVLVLLLLACGGILYLGFSQPYFSSHMTERVLPDAQLPK